MRVTLAVVLLVAFVAGGCSGVETKPFAADDWAAFGDFRLYTDKLGGSGLAAGREVDSTIIAINAGGGYFVHPNIMLGARFGVTDTDTSYKPGAFKTETADWMLAFLGRFYILNEDTTRPWIEIFVGPTRLDVAMNPGGSLDSTSWGAGGALGLSQFIASAVSVDVFFRYTYAKFNDFGISGLNLSRNQYGFFAGLTVFF